MHSLVVVVAHIHTMYVDEWLKIERLLSDFSFVLFPSLSLLFSSCLFFFAHCFVFFSFLHFLLRSRPFVSIDCKCVCACVARQVMLAVRHV